MTISTQGDCLQNPAMLVVVMGVSGVGKTTLAVEIAKHFDMLFLDADSLHDEAAIKQMSQGRALTDEQRDPWIQRICKQLMAYDLHGKSCVLAYSGFKQRHSNAVFYSYNKALGILLNADKSLIEQRLQARTGHFMSAQLLTSQIVSMEPVDKEMILLNLNAAEKLAALLLQSVNFINHHRHS